MSLQPYTAIAIGFVVYTYISMYAALPTHYVTADVTHAALSLLHRSSARISGAHAHDTSTTMYDN
eukprot:2642-Heterococcus_DN1.PRE.7